MKGIIFSINILVLVMVISIVSSCTEESNTKKLIYSNSRWAAHKMGSLHILCIPNTNNSTPIILK